MCGISTQCLWLKSSVCVFTEEKESLWLINASHWRRVHLLWFYCKCLHSSMLWCYQLIVFGTDSGVLWVGLLVVVSEGFAWGDKVNVKCCSLQTKVLTLGHFFPLSCPFYCLCKCINIFSLCKCENSGSCYTLPPGSLILCSSTI